MKKIRVGIVFGGKSGEHEVSLLSAKSVLEAIDRSKYEVIPIGIDKDGIWYSGDESNFFLNPTDPAKIRINKASTSVIPSIANSGGGLINSKTGSKLEPVDVFFPVTHGTFGEDGSLQGLFRLAGAAYVGADVLGSAVGMDKDIMKKLLKIAGIPNARHLVIKDYQRDTVNFDSVADDLGTPLFVKPANLGSSVGISKVRSSDEFYKALDFAFRYDRKVIVEESIIGREIECSVLGNDKPIASLPGEILPHHDFYSYEAKYIDEHGAGLEIPAQLDAETVKRIQSMAVSTFKALECSGMARVDFFLRPDGGLLVNEINTLPGFTKISMYPKLWEASGIPYSELIDKLIDLAIERYRKEAALVRSYQ